MPDFNAKNERLKMRYAEDLKVFDGRAETTIDLKLRAIKTFEELTGFADLDSFDYDMAVSFIKKITERKMSAPSRLTAVRNTKGFFQYLAQEGLLQKKHARKAVNAIRLSERERRAGQSRKPVKFHSVEQYKTAIAAMPKGNGIERRDRAMLAFLLLTAARDGAMITASLEHLDLAQREFLQDPNTVHTKGGKLILTWFFPVGDEIIEEIADYVRYLKDELGFTKNDPLFPASARGYDENDCFTYQGLSKKKWTNAQPVRNAFRAAFQAVDMPYVVPHSIRRTLTDLAYEIGVTPEQFKAWSQNYGHKDVSTTYNHYGSLTPERQKTVMFSMRNQKRDEEATDMPKTRDELMAVIREAVGNDGPS